MARFSLSSPSSSARRRRQRDQRQGAATPAAPAAPSDPSAAAKATLPPPPTSSSSPTPQWKWEFPPQDYDYDRSPLTPRDDIVLRDNGNAGNDWSEDESSEESGSSSSEGSDYSATERRRAFDDRSDDDGEEEEEEPPHPLGFESRYGKTRFGLSPESASDGLQRRRPPRDIFDRDDEHAWNALIRIDDDDNNNKHRNQEGSHANNEQSFPPINGYHLSRGNGIASTQQLLHGTSQREEDGGMEELLSGMDRIANLVKAAGYVGESSNDDGSGGGDNDNNSFATPMGSRRQEQRGRQGTSPFFASPHAQPRSTSKLLQLAAACERRQNALPRQMSQSEERRKESRRQTCQGFLLLLQADASRASSANERISERRRRLARMREQERLDEAADEERLLRRREEAERAERDERAADALRSEEERARGVRKAERRERAEREAEEEAAAGTAYISRAASLMQNLETVREGLKEFDKGKSVSRRRLQFKKIVNGKINTLSHDAHKVGEVGQLVVDAVANAANDDAAAANSGEAVQTMGKKYLLDLLAANLIVRVQADGFNGTRGDGFPLAATFAFISTKCEEVGPVLEGHLYGVCPTAIPTLSLTSATKGEGEDDLMESLGMIRDGEGKFESFDKFLKRTEGLISIMANIMSSHPTSHKMLGGHPGALTWLQRFLDLLPAPPSAPLPLLTAPVLVAFLTGAGHMLANRYPTEFKKLWQVIERDVAGRLDESPVGVPSATRLRRVIVEVGLDGLRRELPKGAVASLYDEGKEGGGIAGASSFGQTQQQPHQQTMPATFAPATSAFGQGGGTNSSSSNNWGSSMDDTANPTAPPDNTNPFGGGGSSSGFGTTPSIAPGTSPFGASGGGNQPGFAPATPGPAPFGSSAPAAPFGASAPTAPFGGSTPAPFGTTAPGPSPFGNTAPAAPGPAPFGTTVPASPFGATAGAPGPSPFGAAAPNPSPFGAATTAPGASPFGSTVAPAATGFGGQQQQQSSAFGGGASPFGGAAAPAPSPFGGDGGGNNAGGAKKQPCKFFASGKCNFGDRCKFSHEMGGGVNGPASGQQQQQSFNNNAFGGGGGGQSAKQPCKFFASGNCRHGDQCRFSHEQPGGGGGGAFGGSAAATTPIGGGGFGGQQSSNPSPFGGGGSTGGFGGSSPFGAQSSSPFGGPRR